MTALDVGEKRDTETTQDIDHGPVLHERIDGRRIYPADQHSGSTVEVTAQPLKVDR